VIEALVTEARRRAEFSGAETRAMAIASLRATTEEVRRVNGADLGLVRGTLLEDGRQAALHPGDLPADPAALLAPPATGRRPGCRAITASCASPLPPCRFAAARGRPISASTARRNS
jgi:predicted YcjX-like family ATPase